MYSTYETPTHLATFYYPISLTYYPITRLLDLELTNLINLGICIRMRCWRLAVII